LEVLRFPEELSFVAAAESAVAQAGDEVLRLDLSYAATERPAQVVRDAVRTADVHVLIAGFVYGSEVPDRRLSYPEWEFESAGEMGLPRLVFLLADHGSGQPELLGERVSFARQARFRQRLRGNGLVTATVSSPDELATVLRHMLLQLPRDRAGFAGAGSALDRSVRGVVAGVSSDRESREDALGINWDVHQLALMLASFAVEAPLSVALLGNWGTGKTTFLLHLRQSLDNLVARSAKQAEASGFVTHLRQVTFNVWHYSDDHLWVGLVEHMFRELTRAAPASAIERVRELEAELDQERKEQGRLANELAVLENRHSWLGWIHLPMRAIRLAVAASGGMWRELRRKRTWFTALVAVAGLAAAVYGQPVLAWLGGTVGVAAPAIAVWTWLAERIDEGHKKLRQQKDVTDQVVKETEDKLNRLDPQRRLALLFDEISSAERYRHYRGLVGAIHHDLRRLSDELAAATEGEPQLQRIVLYIDDLDRCSPQRVLEVLQAVNLLLTTDLFMVVVAVDPRWLIESLKAFHGELFSKSVRPLDYLDKIFHRDRRVDGRRLRRPLLLRGPAQPHTSSSTNSAATHNPRVRPRMATAMMRPTAVLAQPILTRSIGQLDMAITLGACASTAENGAES
jgi:hypothetical protein